MPNELTTTNRDGETWALLTSSGIDGALRTCDALAKSGLLPKHLNSGAAVLAIVMRGREMGMGPLEACGAMHYVEGRVVLDASAQLAQAHRAGIRTRWTRSDAEQATLELTRANGDGYTSTYTMDMAKRAGLAGRQTWQRHPESMLRARAITAGIRAFCPEVLGAGAVYSPDEAQDASYTPPPPAPAPAPVVVEAVPHWSEDERVEFCEALAKLDPPLDYNDVADWCESVSQPPPERLTSERRAKLLAHLTSEKGRAAVAAYLAARGGK